MAQFNYIPDVNDQYTGFEVIPAGEYKVQIVDTDIQVPSSGDGQMLVIDFEIVGDAVYSGRRIKEWLKFIGSGDLKTSKQKINTIFFLIGMGKGSKDTAQLHGKVLSILVGVKNAGNDKNGIYREASNYIKKYLPFNGADNDTEDEAEDFTIKKPKFVK
jgi:hypothetical protein